MSRFLLKFGSDPDLVSGDFSVVAGCDGVRGVVDRGDEVGHLLTRVTIVI
jgi:hypothetical protein